MISLVAFKYKIQTGFAMIQLKMFCFILQIIEIFPFKQSIVCKKFIRKSMSNFSTENNNYYNSKLESRYYTKRKV